MNIIVVGAGKVGGNLTRLLALENHNVTVIDKEQGIIEELVNGEWVEYELSSANAPDSKGYYHYYDGYGVQFDTDGTYSYSFVTTMTDGASRTFRISAVDDFTPWPEEAPPPENEDFLNVYIDHEEIYEASIPFQYMFGEITLKEENNLVYTTFTGPVAEQYKEARTTVYSTANKIESGQYFVFKYRIPSTNSTATGNMESWTSTENEKATLGDQIGFTPIADGKWHVAVIDLSKSSSKTYNPDEDGLYCAKYLRIDIFNRILPADVAVDIAYIGIDSDLTQICDLNKADFDVIDYYSGGFRTDLDTSTAQPLT